MKCWYKGESFRVLPNIEISKADDKLWWVSFVWLKFVFEFRIGI